MKRLDNIASALKYTPPSAVAKEGSEIKGVTD